MNLDKLIKLVKLANNNPNDNEANLAARKVCLMIAENNYKFTEPVASMGGSVNSDNIGDLWEQVMRDMRRSYGGAQGSGASNPYSRNPYDAPWPGGYPKERNYYDPYRDEYNTPPRNQEPQYDRAAYERDKQNRADKENYNNWKWSDQLGMWKNIVTNDLMTQNEFTWKYKNQQNQYTRESTRPESEYYYDYMGNKKKKEKPSRILNCRTCKQPKSTRFQGYEAYYECDNCQWTAYTRAKTNE